MKAGIGRGWEEWRKESSEVGNRERKKFLMSAMAACCSQEERRGWREGGQEATNQFCCVL